MTNEQLQHLVEHISLTSFDRPFRHQAVFNRRLKTTGGRYHLKDHHIDINPKMIEDFDEETLVGVIKHELVHYHLAMTGHPYDHRSREFRQLLAAVGGSRYAPAPVSAPAKRRPPHEYDYVCRDCGRHFHRRRRVNTARYVCGVCGGHLRLVTESGGAKPGGSH
ncbi:SprT family protein [Furfurilactobacillus sp. WILCCON 0119]